MLNFREREVAVGVGIAVTREMLSAGCDAVVLKPFDQRGAMFGDGTGMV